MRKELQWFDDEYPQELLKIKNAPDKIHVEGNEKLLNNSIGIVGIVGSRNSTEYGRKYARIFAEALSKRGITIISGMAIGIDTQAHLGGLKGEGKTVAVLGSGLNNVTPEENLWLYNKILNEGGLIISEKEDEEFAKSSDYQKRNRLICGIADCILVVEAKKSSGTLMTARIAKEQGKTVYFLPNRLNEQNSGGMQILAEEDAKMIFSPSQIKIGKTAEINKNSDLNISNISEEYKEVYNCLASPKNVQEIAEGVDLDVQEINTKLTMMELEGLIEKIENGKYRRI